MATGHIELTGNVIPDFTAPCGMAHSNNVPYYTFDDTANETFHVALTIPNNYASAPVLKMIGAPITTQTGVKSVDFEAAVWATSATESLTSASFDTANTLSGGKTDLASGIGSGTMFLLTHTLTNADSMAVGDRVVIKVTRVATDTTNDTVVGDVAIFNVYFEYTTT